MAKAIFEHMVNKDADLRTAGIDTRSAGTCVVAGGRATEKAMQVMRVKGLDISFHVSKRVDGVLVDWADLILVMQGAHMEHIKNCFPHSVEKVKLLTHFVGEEGEVPDPLLENTNIAYRECANLLESLTSAMIERMK
jgi:protein-tyrosine phosphatase